jgi:hypothetical protein
VKFNGSTWDTPQWIANTTQSNSIAVDDQEKVYVAYHNNQATGGLYYASSYDPVPWTQEDIHPDAASGFDIGKGCSIAIDGDTLYASYVDKLFNCIRCRYKQRYNHGAGQWVALGGNMPDDSADSKGEITSLAIADGKPHIAYTDTTTNYVMYTYFDGGNWVQPENVAPNNNGKYVSIDVRYYNRPHIAFYDQGTTSLRYARKDEYGVWQIEPIEERPGETVGEYPSIKLDSKGSPHIAYYDVSQNVLKYACKTPLPPLKQDKDVRIGNNVFDPRDPDPDKNRCRIMYELSGDQDISINVYDLAGNWIKTIIEEHKPPGSHGEDEWFGDNDKNSVVTPGIYYIVVEGDDWKTAGKVAITDRRE